MIETIVKDYLETKTNVPVRFERSPEMPDQCIVLEKTGGSHNEQLFTATMAVQSYGKTLADAALLNANVVYWMLDIRDAVTNVFDISLNSDYNFTDTASKRYRYQAVFVVTYHN